MQSPQDETLTHVFLTHFSQRFLKQNYPKNISDVPSKILEKKEHNYQIFLSEFVIFPKLGVLWRELKFFIANFSHLSPN